MVRDFAIMQRCALLLAALPVVGNPQLKDSLMQFGAPLKEQLDLKVEADNLNRLECLGEAGWAVWEARGSMVFFFKGGLLHGVGSWGVVQEQKLCCSQRVLPHCHSGCPCRFTTNFRYWNGVAFPKPAGAPLVSSDVLVETFEEGELITKYMHDTPGRYNKKLAGGYEG